MEKPSTDQPRETKPEASSGIESLIRIPEIKRQDLGLKVLYENQDVDEIEVDIVAVHGIMADPNTTWTHKKTNTNWLSDPSMLPESLKGHKARIMSFGYDSRWFGKDSTRQSLYNLAEDFLYQLNQTREAYNKSCMQPGDFPGVWQSMRGMVFLGTPHSGVNEGSSMSRQGEIYAAIAASKMEIQDNVLQSIMRDNDVLESTRAEFTRKEFLVVKEHLKHEEQWLMVLDGLNDDESLHFTNSNPGQEPKPLLSFLPKPSDNHRLLITTTQRTLALRQMNSKDKNVLSVGDLTRDDASRLLLGRVASSSTNGKRIGEIISIVGDSAGALELVRLCGIFTQTAFSSQLLDLLRKNCKGSEDGESPKPAWSLLWNSLKAKNSELAYWFHVIGLLDLQMIPSIFFSNNERKTLLEELTKLGLVEHSDGRSFYRVTAFFRQCLESTITEKQRMDAEAALMQSVNTKFIDDERSVLLPVALAALKLKAGRPDAKRGQDILREKVESYRKQRQSSLSPDIGYLPDDPRRLSTSYGWDQLRRSTLEGSFNQRTGLPNSHQRSISEDSSGWPSWQRLQRRLMDPEWEKRRETLRKDSIAAAQILSHGRPPNGSEDATSIYRRVIDGYSAEPEEYLKLASLQYNLAIAQGSEGMVDDAATTFRQALQTILSGDDPRTRNIEATKLYYRIYTDLASMYVSDGRFAEAEETFMHFLPSQAKDLGQDSQQTLKTRHEFARLLQERGQSELGGQELERILKANERVLGSNHRDTLTSQPVVA
ncbi:hypothetical protein COL26b_014104 [Colletotrichum chrysophilum]|uniref:uncharacterized protein n=1 Tax=Colletotrichum chrysophilum TaxID=1836956 RepID=UPI002301216F|nr:uncharacterized protein COL26b_014104 [Colletotrichum chrysophilum]KAJ0360386.1 hypothetical protein COL26b_014104 [Colletotrichum chrysophilum]